jgi:hypothetical protein
MLTVVVDEQVALQGSGFQNGGPGPGVSVLTDCGEVCRVWRSALDANQNTEVYGRA